jgi:hypothetical protein
MMMRAIPTHADARRRRPWSVAARVAAALTAAAVLLLLAGCAGRTQTASAPQTPGLPPAGPRPASTAAVAIVSPAPGERISGATLHVRIQLTGATIVPQTSASLSPDKGHIHLSIDGRVVSMAYGIEQDVPVSPGTHLLTAEFVATDHFPFNPRVIKTVTFDVQ